MSGMPANPWYRNTVLFVLVCLLLPPAGLILLWMRPRTGAFRKLFVSFALVILTIVHLFAFYGLRAEFAGSGMRPIFTFHNPESHYDAMERDRKLEGGVVKAASAAGGSGSVYWTDFRGPNRDGHYDQQPIRTDWPSDGPPEMWRIKVGGGYASVVIAEGRIFTIEQRRGQEVVAAYSLDSGKELWTHGWAAFFQERLGGDGPRATPTWNEGKVYALGGEGELRCLDATTGELIWKHDILKENDADNLVWGMSASVLVVDDKVIALPGGTNDNSIVAYDKLTGEVLWKSLSDAQAYTAPMLVTLAGQRQLLIVSAERMMGVSVEDGALLWEYPWVTHMGINASQPLVIDENHVFISAAYGHGSVLVKLTRAGDSFQTEEVWKSNRMKNKFNSSILYEGHIYGLDEAIMACVDPRTGELKWKGGRYGFGQVLLAGGHLIVLTEKGDLVLVKATPESHQEVARFSALSGKTWNHPALADGKLIVRNQTEMACYDVSGS